MLPFPDPSPHWQPVLCSLYLWVCFCLVILNICSLFYFLDSTYKWRGFPGGSDGKESGFNTGDTDMIPGSQRSPGEGNGYPLQYSFLENSMDRGAWQATVQGTAESDTAEQLTLSQWVKTNSMCLSLSDLFH